MGADGVVAILVPSEEGTPLTGVEKRPGGKTCCDPRPLRRGDATSVGLILHPHGLGCDPRPLRRGDATCPPRDLASLTRRLLRSSSPPKRGRHLAWPGELDGGGVVAILVPSEEGTPPPKAQCSTEGCPRLRSSSPPKRGRHDLVHQQDHRRRPVAILVPSEEGTPLAEQPVPRLVVGEVAILVPSEEGTPLGKLTPHDARQRSCDPRPLRRGDATLGGAQMAHRLTYVAILVPSEEGTPQLRVPGSVGAVDHELRSSSPPKRGRHPNTTTSSTTCPRGCDPRPLRRGDATGVTVGPLARTGVAILVPSEEGTPPLMVPSNCTAADRVAILVPSEEGTPPARPGERGRG